MRRTITEVQWDEEVHPLHDTILDTDAPIIIVIDPQASAAAW